MKIEDQIGKIVAEACVSINGQWEEILRLHIKPKPKWMSKLLYHKLVGMVFQQSTERLK